MLPLSARFVGIFVLSLMIGVLHLPCFYPLSALMRWKTVRTSLPVTVRFHPHTKIDHLILPELGLAFLTENRFHDLSGLIDQPTLISQRHIHAKRFLDLDSLRRHKKRLSFNQKAAAQMIAQAVYLLSENKELHDQLEQIYLSAMDFSMMDDVLESVVAQMIDFKIAREGSSLL